MTASTAMAPYGAASEGVFASLDSAVESAHRAYREFLDVPWRSRGRIIAAIRSAAREAIETLSRRAREETGLGRYEDKLAKNRLAIDKTPGTEVVEPLLHRGDDGVCVEDLAPWGVIGVLTPCTNPSETVINNAISMLAAGNAMVFCPHPAARETSIETAQLIQNAITASGGPENLVTILEHPSREMRDRLLAHPMIRLITVTGGPDAARAALLSGKHAVAAGPGNPPVLVDETADIEKAGRNIVAGASLDNNIICVCEKQIIAVDAIVEPLRRAMVAAGGFELPASHLPRLEKLLLAETKTAPEPSQTNRQWMGKDAREILAAIGIDVDESIRLIIVATDAAHPFVWTEMLTPVLPLVTVPDFEQGLRLAVETERGLGHTAVLHSRDIERLSRMARAVRTSLFVGNGPGVAGVGFGAEGHTSFTIAGATGHGFTTARTFTRLRRSTFVRHLNFV